MPVEDWETTIRKRFTAQDIADQNLKAFHCGRDYALSLNVTCKG
jgi:Pyruvate/2-oxoacid:ferredoxin oxidoreductase gamma subunit